jgi:CheY-like chemotaxis protein
MATTTTLPQTTDNLPKVLCVDDEPQVLAGLTLHLRRRYNLSTATSGADGLKLLESHRDMAVVVSDMRMPSMDGAAFLSKARQAVPDAVRILLTGQSDMDSAISAVNEGQIFRFLTKPCPSPLLLASIQAACEHHRLITAERVLLEQTLRGSIKALSDVLSLTDPLSFGRGSRVKELVSNLAAHLGIEQLWQVEVAAMLSQLGCIALPAETTEKLYYGRSLTDDEQEMVDRVPRVTEDLLGSIPRLESVLAILSGSSKSYRAVDLGTLDAEARLVHDGAHLLRVAVDFDVLETQGKSAIGAIDVMRGRSGAYDPRILDALIALQGVERGEEVREVGVADLQIGMVFAEDVRTDSDTLLVARGFEVTAGMVERARNARRGSIKEPIRVIVPRQS